PDEIEIGEILIVRPGEKIAVDGVIIEGETMLDTSSLTGESVPYAAKVGDEVLSGTINSASLIKVRAKKVFGQSAVSKILDLVENAGSKKAKTENFITEFAKIYTPVVVVLAVIIAVVPSLITGRWGDFVHRAMMFLVISCPCALVISVPLAYFAGIGGASSKGILVKGSNYLEALAAVKTVVFDKTGTLTKGTFGITKISPAGTDEASLLKLAASAEKYSTHPVAMSVSEACDDVREPESVREISGKGVVAVIDGKTVVCGNAALMREYGVEFIETYDAGTVLYVAENGKYLGSIIVSDEIKPDSMVAISKLRQAGIGPVMLTGDKKSAAEKVADALGISEYHAELLPDEKVDAMEKIMEDGRGKTAFVGDGINDAPVLMRADVGIAMGALGSDAAIEAADIVLTDDKPSKIHTAVKIARKTSAIVKENIAFALAVKITVLALGAFGVMQEMGLAVFADVGVALIAILNSMRAMKIKNA
ncbi:MAG: cadmium-translocating P-type ATPase, partial [Clostridiales bacterium]|nr:cadmium-translocating P-type ATPase [Clostridiales bacterium]